MASGWAAFQECGAAAWAVLFSAMLTAMIGLVAVGVAISGSKAGRVVAFVAFAFALLPAGCGVAGTSIGRSKVEGALAGESIEPDLKVRIRAQGYAEAAQCTSIGGVCGAPGILLSLAAIAVALTRRRQPQG